MKRHERVGPATAGSGTWVLWAIVVIAAGVIAAWAVPWGGVKAPAWAPAGGQIVIPEAAARQIAALRIGEKQGRESYRRDRFGAPWFDEDHNGCDTRNDVLRRDLDHPVMKGHEGCAVARGTLHDPYTGRDIEFIAGKDSRRVQIDHVVALADAWSSGARDWPNERRRAFANDPENLLAVDGPANEEKGADDAAAWLPPNIPFRCPYVLRQARVKARYGLSVTEAERSAMLATLGDCQGTG